MSEKQGTRRRLPRPATVLAAIAVFAVLAGTATAAKTVIDGSQIKKGTITAKQIKNRSLTPNKFSAAAVSQLQGPRGQQGQRGERGPQGEKGAAGEKGAQGPAGIVAPLYVEEGNTNILDGDEEFVGGVATPAGKYMINVKINLSAVAAGTDIECFVDAGNAQVDEVRWTNDEANGAQPVSLLAVANATPADPIDVFCAADGGTGAASQTHIAAVPVS
jgi:hypothetical protein